MQTAPSGQTISARLGGFCQPLEASRHERSFMQWPVQARIHGGKRGLDEVRGSIARIASALVDFEPVVMLVDQDSMAQARSALGQQITLWPIATDDLWCRDSGPTFLRNRSGQLAVSDLNFNGWGGKQTCTKDSRIAASIADMLDLPLFNNGLTGEGGGVEVDGEGTIIAHESCWVNRNRNRHDKAGVERLLLDALGAEHMIWAPGLKGADITDCHIDAMARFVKPGQVVMQLPRNTSGRDPWSICAFQTYEILKAARDAQGRKLDVAVIHEPDYSRLRVKSSDFVASYVNYYVCNGGVISAEFGDDRSDAAARHLLGQLYPGRTVITLDIDPIAKAGGGIHCSIQQQPAASL